MGRIKFKTDRAKKVHGTTERPRLAVKKSLRYISAQIIDDEKGVTLAAAVSPKGESNNIETAKKTGVLLAQKAKAAGVTKLVFDRRKYLYHGKIKALAEAVREGGLEF